MLSPSVRSQIPDQLKSTAEKCVVTRNIGLEGGAMAHTVEFERCVDFLARMIEKYGSELLQELNGLPKEDKAEDNCQQEQQQNTLGND